MQTRNVAWHNAVKKRFADEVLALLSRVDDWSAETLDDIAIIAEKYDLVAYDTGLFKQNFYEPDQMFAAVPCGGAFFRESLLSYLPLCPGVPDPSFRSAWQLNVAWLCEESLLGEEMAENFVV